MRGRNRQPRAAPDPPWLQTTRRLAWLAAVLLLLAVPLVWDITAANPFRAPKSGLALASWVVLAGIAAVSWTRATWRDPWLLPWVGVSAAAVLSAVTSSQPLRATAALLPILLVALGIVALRQFPDSRRVTLRTVVLVSTVIQSLLALAFRSPALEPPSYRALEATSGRFTVVGTLGNPADVAVFVAVPAVLAAALALETRRGRWVLVATSLLLTGVAVFTATVTVVAAMGVGFALLLARRLPARVRPVGLAALAVALLAVATLGPLAQRLDMAVEQLRRGDWLWLGSGRAVSFAAALAMVRARPLTGVGFGLFGAESYRFQSEEALAVRGRILDLVTGFGEAHSEPLQFLAETGLVGAALLAGACLLAWRRGARLGGVLPAVGPLAAVAGLVAAAQFPLHLATVAAQWAVLLSLAMPPLPAPPTGRRGGWGRLLAVLLIAAAGAGIAWSRHRAARAIRAAEVLVNSIRAGGPDAPPPQLAALALPRLEAHLRWLPYSAAGELAAGNLAIEAKRPEVALRHFQRGLALGERPEAHFDVGMTLLLLGDREGGTQHLVRAVKLNPAVFKRVVDPEIASELRRRLEADGYAARHPWVFQDTPAAMP